MKKTLYCVWSGCLCALYVMAALTWVAAGGWVAAKAFWSLLLCVGLLHLAASKACEKLGIGHYAARLLPVAFSALLVGCITAVRFAANSIRPETLAMLAAAYFMLVVLTAFCAWTTRSDKPFVRFAPIGTEAGKAAIRKIRLLQYGAIIAMVLPAGLLLEFYVVQDRLWALLVSPPLILGLSVMSNMMLTRFSANLLLEKMDPAAYYDLLVYLLRHAGRRRRQQGLVANMILAYADMGQRPVARKLADRLWAEPGLTQVQRAQIAMHQAVLCEELYDFHQKARACQDLLGGIQDRRLAQQIETNLRGRQARLENDAAGLLWFAGQIEQTMAPCRRNQVVAALNRARGWELTGETGQAKAAWAYIAANGGRTWMAEEARAALHRLEEANV